MKNNKETNTFSIPSTVMAAAPSRQGRDSNSVPTTIRTPPPTKKG